MGLARLALCTMLLGVCAWTAQAAVIDTFVLQEAGWQVSGSSAYEIGLSVDSVGVDPNGRRFVAVEISKKFRYGPDPQTGVMPSITMDFTQIADDANTATRLIIADETITNLTGTDWTDFHWVLFRHGVASFNQSLTDVGAGFSVAPFTQWQWQVNEQLDNEELSVFAGTVPSGGIFIPGDGLGNLVIDIDLVGPRPVSFTFKQIPTPEPASAVLLLLGGLALRAKRRR